MRQQIGEIDAAGINAWRRAGFEAIDTKRQLPQSLGKPIGRRITRPAALALLQAHMDHTAEERTNGKDDRACAEFETHLRHDAANPARFHHQVLNRLLEHRQARLIFDDVANSHSIQLPVSLGSRRPHRRAFTRIQGAKLNARPVSRDGHCAPQGVNLPHEVTFADPANSGITGHLTERLQILGKQERARAHTRRRQAGFGASVTAANHNNVKFGCVSHFVLRRTGQKGRQVYPRDLASGTTF